MKVYIQIPYYNKHITPIFDELSRLPETELSVGLLKEGRSFRRGYDWDSGIDENIYIKLWEKRLNKNLLKNSDVIGVHGFLSVWKNYFLIVYAILQRKKVLIFSEGIKKSSWLNKLAKRIVINVVNSKKVTFFELGDQAYEDYFQLGANRWKSYKFAYSVDPVERENTSNGEPLKVIYVGQIIERKRVFDLINAFDLVLENVQLSIFGEGDLKEDLIKVLDNMGDDRINYGGVLSKEEIIGKMVLSDCLVLPSEYDGWGAVVNEAMECGLAVIVSSGVRSKSLVKSEYIFPKGDVEKLAKIINDLALDKNRLQELKVWNRNKIKSYRPKMLAKFVIDKIK